MRQPRVVSVYLSRILPITRASFSADDHRTEIDTRNGWCILFFSPGKNLKSPSVDDWSIRSLVATLFFIYIPMNRWIFCKLLFLRSVWSECFRIYFYFYISYLLGVSVWFRRNGRSLFLCRCRCGVVTVVVLVRVSSCGSCGCGWPGDAFHLCTMHIFKKAFSFLFLLFYRLLHVGLHRKYQNKSLWWKRAESWLELNLLVTAQRHLKIVKTHRLCILCLRFFNFQKRQLYCTF